MFYALINAPNSKSGGIIEFTFWKYLTKMFETSHESIVILSLPGKNEKLERPTVNDDLWKLEGFKPEELIIDVTEDIELNKDDKFYSSEEIL